MGLLQAINSVIPFADPSRPLWIDVIYSLVLCTVLWLGPQLQRLIEQRREKQTQGHEGIIEDQVPLDPQNHRPPFVQDEVVVPGDAHRDEDEDEDFDLDDEEDDADHVPIIANEFIPDNDPIPVDQRPPPFAEQPLPQPVAQPNQPQRLRDPNRPVGAKKARSLARRQQTRAYHEFMREQSDMVRAQDASTRDEREKAQAAERTRRAAIEAKIREDEAAAREARKAKEAKEREDEVQTVKKAVKLVRNRLKEGKVVRLEDLAQEVGREEEWVSTILRTEGVLGVREGKDGKEMVMISATGYLVKIGIEDMKELYTAASKSDASNSEGGRIPSQELAKMLSSILMKSTTTQ